MEAITQDGQITPLYTGFPVWSVYFADLTGDGLPELCSTVSLSFGIVDDRIIIYDYANGASYTLEDRGEYDYTLSMEKGMLLVTKRVYASDEIVETGYLTYQNETIQIVPLETGTMQRPVSLESAISQAILEHYAGDEKDGLIRVESHVLLDSQVLSGTPLVGETEHMAEETAYLLVLCERYSTYGGELEAVDGSYIPTAITFSVSKRGEYTLKEYWEPRDGSRYTEDIQDQFPDSAQKEVWNADAYVDALEQENQRKAQAYLDSTGSVDARIAALLETVCSSPAQSGDPGAYIAAHQEEYDRLLNYEAYTLRYCFTAFLQGGQTDLRGEVMAMACQEIMLSRGEAVPMLDRDPPRTGQDWFDEIYSNALWLENQYSPEELEKHHPTSALLLELMNSAE